MRPRRPRRSCVFHKGRLPASAKAFVDVARPAEGVQLLTSGHFAGR